MIKQVAYVDQTELIEILKSTTHINAKITVELSEDKFGRWVNAEIYFNEKQMKELRRIMVRNNINRRGRDETVKSAG